jgi:hypothetical protein
VRPAVITLVLVCSLALAACGNTLQDQPIPHNTLETLIVNPFPVYWVGGSFHGLAITEASHDSSGAFTVQYGDCLEGGQGTCVAPLQIITSADNSFLPAGGADARHVQIRGVPATVARNGRTVLLATGPVVVGIYAANAPLARVAAAAVTPINEPGAPGAPLPPPQPSTGYGEAPLASQEPQPLHPVR